MTDTVSPPGLVRWAAYTAVLFAGLAYNLYGVPDGVYWSREVPRAGYVGYDSALVLNRVAEARAGLHPLHPLVMWWPDQGRRDVYRSQFGLQGVTLSAVARWTRAEPGRLCVAAAPGFALLTAAVLAAFFADTARRVGPTAGNVGVALSCATPILLPFAASVYWTAFTLFAPFVAAWLLLPWAVGRPARKMLVLAAVGGLVAVKCLCGYEYVSTVVLGPAAAAAYHAARTGVGLRRWAVWSAGLTAAGVAGFAVALGLHLAQLEAVVGVDGLGAIRERAAHRTAAADTANEVLYPFAAPDPTGVPGRWRLPARCFLNYFYQPAVSAPGWAGRLAHDVSLGTAVGAVLGLAVTAVLFRRRLPRAAWALAPATAVGFLASASWQVLAVNHMCVHAHLNQIVFVAPFLLVGYTLAGVVVQLLADARGLTRYADAAGLLVAVVAAGASIGTTADRAGLAAELDRRAAAAVADRLRLGGAVPPPQMPHAVDSVMWADRPAHPALGGPPDRRLTPTAAGPIDPGWAATGWAFDPSGRAGEQRVRVVAVRGGVVVPARVERFRRPDLEVLAGGRMPGAGFRLTVRDADGAGRLRLFLVGGADGAAVWELPLPVTHDGER